jgi:putative peptide zinc metalloprotease protein
MDGTLVKAASLADMLSSAQASAKKITLPPLREELRLLPAAANRDGSPAWMVHDPINNRFFRVGWLDFEMLLRWAQGNPRAIAESVSEETTLSIDEGDVGSLLHFLEQHNLLQANSAAAVDRLRRRSAQMKKNVYEWLLHNYLFFRVPLIRPQVWLAATMPFLNWLFKPVTGVALIALTVTGVFLATRQWETFVSTLVEHLSVSGFLGYAVALVFAKTLHEMGHAITATRYGVRVAHMGVAMLVMFPMLYTDTSESWKLTKPRQRLAIASAGIITELAIAGLATLAWSLTSDGALKNGLFFLATTSWVLTVLLNMSPFMRFDGYFIVSDLLDFPNLHERSGALARTWLRRTLLGFDEHYSERVPGNGNVFLIAFALGTWVYRLTLFFGIALLVYYFFFKVLGIFLMMVELVWFIARPVWTELRVWRSRKAEIKPNRKRIAWALLAVFLLLGLVPWQTSIHGTGWVHPEQQQIIYTPLAGKVISLPAASDAVVTVKQGQVLFALESPDLRLGAQKATDQASARARELLGLSGLPNGEEQRAQLQMQQNKFLAEANVYQGEQLRLQVAAPFAGELRDLDPQLTTGVWVQPRQPLGVVIDPSSWTIEAYVPEVDVARIRVGDKVRAFMGLRSIQAFTGQVQEIDTARTTILPHALLDAKSGGPIVTLAPNADDHRERVPKDAIYRVRITLDRAPFAKQANQQMMLASVTISGESRAWLPSVFSRIAAVLVRESGF